MSLPRSLQWTAGILLAPPALAVLFIAIFGWNWLRGPIERTVLAQTGRVLQIGGDLTIGFGWPLPHLQANAVSFANPDWAKEKQALTADLVDLSIDLPQLLRKKIVVPELRLVRPQIFLEKNIDGRKSWLLDRDQKDEESALQIGRIAVDQGNIGYDDAGEKTSLRAVVSTAASGPGSAELSLTVHGSFRGLPLKAKGKGGPVLGLADEATPYPLQVELEIGSTGASFAGTVTSLLKIAAVDLRLQLHGKSMAQLYPLLGIVFPETGPYRTEGHLIHSAKSWRYEKFSGRIGRSDIAGSLQVELGGTRPALQADLSSSRLDVADLGTLIGAKPGRVQAARQAAAVVPATQATTAGARLLPDMAFRVERWDSVDAELSLKAKTIVGVGALPLEDFVTRLHLRDEVLRIDPLQFRFAGGSLDAALTLDGRQKPIRAQGRLRVIKLSLAKILPASTANLGSSGQISGEFDLVGAGDSVRGMIENSSGKLGLVVSGGRISRLMMEKVGIHLWEIMKISLTSDKLITLRCGVADFAVKDGIMSANALIFDTEITTILGTGTVDLKQERLDLTLSQATKKTSPLALRSPIYIRGTFARPVAGVDKKRLAARVLGALALGLVNPLLVVLPLIDAGPGKDSDCGQLVREARAMPAQ